MAHDTYWYVLITLRGLWFSRHLRTRLSQWWHSTSNPFVLSFFYTTCYIEWKRRWVSECGGIRNLFTIWTKQTFTGACHPASKGLVERANRKILEVLRSIVNELLDNLEDWLPHVAASLNSLVSDSTGKSPYCILYGVEKRLPYDLLTNPQQPVYNTDNYTQQ